MKKQEATVRVYNMDILELTFKTENVYMFIDNLDPDIEFSLFKSLVTTPDGTRTMTFSLNVYKDDEH